MGTGLTPEQPESPLTGDLAVFTTQLRKGAHVLENIFPGGGNSHVTRDYATQAIVLRDSLNLLYEGIDEQDVDKVQQAMLENFTGLQVVINKMYVPGLFSDEVRSLLEANWPDSEPLTVQEKIEELEHCREELRQDYWASFRKHNPQQRVMTWEDLHLYAQRVEVLFNGIESMIPITVRAFYLSSMHGYVSELLSDNPTETNAEFYEGLLGSYKAAAERQAIELGEQPAAELPPPEVSRAEPLRRAPILEISSRVLQIAREEDFSGAFSLMRKSTIVAEFAGGFADRTRGIFNQKDTRFNIGELGRLFTHVAVQQLVQEGVLESLDDKIGVHVSSGLLPENIRNEVTVREVLQGAVALGDYRSHASFGAVREELRELSRYLPLLEEEVRRAQAERLDGNNYIVLGVIVEALRGGSFSHEIQRHIFDRAAMKSSGYDSSAIGGGRLAYGYQRRAADDEWAVLDVGGDGEANQAAFTDNRASLLPVGNPAEGPFSTTHDLQMFSRALGDRIILNDEQVRILLGEDSDGPIGLRRTRVGRFNIVGYDTAIDGVNAAFDLYPDTGHSCVILGNTTDSDLDFVNRVRHWLCTDYLPRVAA